MLFLPYIQIFVAVIYKKDAAAALHCSGAPEAMLHPAAKQVLVPVSCKIAEFGSCLGGHFACLVFPLVVVNHSQRERPDVVVHIFNLGTEGRGRWISEFLNTLVYRAPLRVNQG